jgi:methionyl-tRNA formyltransferase
MKIDAGLDTGPVIDQQTIMLDQAENFESLHDKLGQLGADIIKKSLLPYLDGKLPLQPQDNKLATLTTIISKEDGRIEWTKSANDIYRQIRAYTPWPGAYCFWKQTRKESVEQRLKILSAKPSNSTHPLAPGHIALQDSHLTVGCGGHGLILTRIQLEGKKPLPVDEFIKGYPEFIQAVLS